MSIGTTREHAPHAWDEADLATGLMAGDGAVRAAFVERTHDAVYPWTCRLTTDRDLRRDWTHDALLRVMDDLRSGAFEYRRPGSFWAWFRTRARFLVLESRRRETVHAQRETLSVEGDVPDRPATDDPSLDLEETEAAAALAACLDGLDNRDHARALELRAVEDQPYERIAEIMDAPLNTVRAWIRRGRTQLRRCLAARFGWTLPEEEA